MECGRPFLLKERLSPLTGLSLHLSPLQGRPGRGCSLPRQAPEPRMRGAGCRGVPGLGLSCRPGRRGRAGRGPSAPGSGRCRGRPKPRSPSPQAGGEGLSPLKLSRWGRGLRLCPPGSGRRPLPPRPLPSRGRREEADAKSSGRARLGGAGSGRRDPGLGHPGSRRSAPSCACAGAVRYASCAGAGPSSAAPRRARRRLSGESARGAPPAGAPGYKKRRAEERRGPRRTWGAPGRVAPCATRPGLSVEGREPLHLSPPSPNQCCAARPEAATAPPHSASEGNFRP